MDFREYQARSGDTDRLLGLSASTRTHLYLAGLFDEAGEVSDATKLAQAKVAVAVEEELGDVLWYIARMAERYGLDLNDVAEKNLAKLKARHLPT